MKPKEIMTANKDQIISDYLAGASTCELGRKFKVSNGSIFLFLQKNNIPIRQTKVRATNKDKVLELHSQGLSAYEITKQLGLGNNAANRIIKDAGFDISHKKKGREDKLTDHKTKIINLYNKGIGSYTIGKLYKADDSSIRSRLVAWDVKMRPLRRIEVNEAFFDNIDDERKAYILGLLMADGHNHKDKYKFSLAITDLDILETIVEAIGYKGKIRLQKMRKKNKKPMYRLRVSSKRMNEALVKAGCVYRKTYGGKFPEVREDLQQHLIRGWLDGDGTIYKTKRGQWGSAITGNSEYCDGIIDVLTKLEISTVKTLLSINEQTGHRTHNIVIHNGQNNLNLEKFLDWIYKESEMKLSRKYKRYLRFKAELAEKSQAQPH